MYGAEKFRQWLRRPLIEKKDSEPPDYRPMAEASKESARIAAELGREQLDFAKQQYADQQPLLQQITDSQVATQNQTNAQAQDYYNYQQKTFRPLEEKMVAEADSFNTEAYREQQASKAAADTGRAFASTQAMTNRGLSAMGVNPNSGKALALGNQNALGLAASRAGAMTNARTQADNVGYARRLDAVGMGRNLTGASQGAYGLALQAGNSAANNSGQAGSQYMAGMGQAANTTMQGRSLYQSGLGGVLNAQTSVYNSDSQSGLDVGGLLSGAAKAYTAFS